MKKVYTNPETGNTYNLTKGEKIDPIAEGIGITEEKRSPEAKLNGKDKYRRIFIRLRNPQEVITCRPIEDEKDFAQRVAIIEQWFKANVRDRDIMLDFAAYPYEE